MKLVVTSDWHLDHVSHGVSRFEELARAVDKTVETAVEIDADAYVFLGDLCDPDSGSVVFRCIELAIRTGVKLASYGIDSIWVAGNHDVIEDGTGDTTLSPLRGVADGVVVFERPGAAMIAPKKDGEAVNLIALPFAATSHAYDVAKVGVELARGYSSAKTLIAAHLCVPGVEPGEETKELPRGREVILPVSDLRPHAATIMNGHYHRQQRSPDGVWIPGALARLTFCEERNAPGFLIVEI